MESMWVNAGTLGFMVAMFAVVFKMIMRQRADLNKCKDDLATFKEKVAEEYAPRKYLDKIEQRILDAMKAMEHRLERLINHAPRGSRA